MENFENLEEVRISGEQIFDGYILHVYKDEVRLPNGNTSEREYISHMGAVGIVALTDDDEIILEHQFRYPLHKVITEIPAGKLDGPDEDRLDAAKRELLEETGITADEWTDLGNYHPSAAYCSEMLTLYLARGLHMGTQQLDRDEFLNIFRVPLDEAVRMVLDGTITDGKSISAILKAAVYTGHLRQD